MMGSQRDPIDVVVIGAGPAGLAAAARAREIGLKALLLDEQEAPGGQIYRGIEAASSDGSADRLGPDYTKGAALAARFRASGADYWPSTQVWQIEPSWQIYATSGGTTRKIAARRVIIAVGGIERPVPFDGWTTPGVLTVGAAQILLKASGITPQSPFWIAGQGPLVLLYTAQLLASGVEPDGLLLTTARGALSRAMPHAARAMTGWPDLAKGLSLIARIRRSGIPIVRGVEDLAAIGTEQLEAVRYVRGRTAKTVPATTLLVHEGVVPNAHMTQAIGCAHVWNSAQGCIRPLLDEWGRTSAAGVAAAGDCGGIIGAAASAAAGEIAAVGVALDLERISAAQADGMAAPLRSALRRLTHIRPVLDAIYRPRRGVRTPPDDVMVCRCEERTARDIREAVRGGCIGPNQVKAFTRAGMGSCQGRECALTITELVAEATGTAPGATGFLRIRPPLKPVTLGELAMLATTDEKETA